MKKKIIIFLVVYLLIGRILSWNSDSPDNIANKGIFYFLTAMDKLNSYIDKETFNEFSNKSKKQLPLVWFESKEQKLFLSLLWGLMIIFFVFYIAIFFAAAMLIFIIKTVWFFLVVPFFTFLWELMLIIFG